MHRDRGNRCSPVSLSVSVCSCAWTAACTSGQGRGTRSCGCPPDSNACDKGPLVHSKREGAKSEVLMYRGSAPGRRGGSSQKRKVEGVLKTSFGRCFVGGWSRKSFMDRSGVIHLKDEGAFPNHLFCFFKEIRDLYRWGKRMLERLGLIKAARWF